MFLSALGAITEPLTGRRWDADAVRAEVARRVAAYAHLGVQPGDMVFLHHGNRLEFFADLSAIWLVGGCAVPIDARLTAFEVEHLARAARPRFAVWHETPDEAIATCLTSLAVRHVDPETLADAAKRGQAPSEARLRLDDAALVLFTSGTTGDPKGVVHTHRSLRARWITLRQHLGLERYRRTLCLLPTHFGHGLICNCLFPWLSGADLFVLPPFRPDVVLRLGSILDEYGITFMSSVPSLWRLALRTAAPPESGTLERVFCGSAPLSATLWNGIREWTGTREVWNSYGITETGSWVAGTSIGEFEPADGLIGVPWGAVIKILRRDTAQPGPPLDEVCAPGEEGFVWLNTPALMQGYFRRDDLTNRVVSNGWFMTGDIGYLNESGHLVLRGRVRDEINKGGMKIFPADIDAVVERADGVTDVCAFGYEGDPLYGENVGIALVVADAADGALRRLHAFVSERLAAHQMPERWYVIDGIPRTSRGKVNRSQVAAACADLTPLDWRRIRQGES